MHLEVVDQLALAGVEAWVDFLAKMVIPDALTDRLPLKVKMRVVCRCFLPEQTPFLHSLLYDSGIVAVNDGVAQLFWV